MNSLRQLQIWVVLAEGMAHELGTGEFEYVLADGVDNSTNVMSWCKRRQRAAQHQGAA